MLHTKLCPFRQQDKTMKKITLCLITLIACNTILDLHAGKKRKKIKRENFYTWCNKQPKKTELQKALNKQIFYAAHKNNWDVIRAITEHNPNYRGLFGDTPLHYAVRQNHAPTIAWAIENGADPTIANIYDQTPLTIAMLNGDTESAKLLLSQKPQNIFIKTIATQIKRNRNAKRQQKYLLDTIDFMVKNKLVDINKADEFGHFPLHSSIKTENAPLAKALIQAHNIRLNQKDSSGATALHFAIVFGQSDIVRNLISTNADIGILDNDQNSPLDIATQAATSTTPIAQEKHHLYTEIVDILTQYGAPFHSIMVMEEIRSTKSTEKKINPNAKPCPDCGADKKYKKCCGTLKKAT